MKNLIILIIISFLFISKHSAWAKDPSSFDSSRLQKYSATAQGHRSSSASSQQSPVATISQPEHTNRPAVSQSTPERNNYVSSNALQQQPHESKGTEQPTVSKQPSTSPSQKSFFSWNSEDWYAFDEKKPHSDKPTLFLLGERHSIPESDQRVSKFIGELFDHTGKTKNSVIVFLELAELGKYKITDHLVLEKHERKFLSAKNEQGFYADGVPLIFGMEYLVARDKAHAARNLLLGAINKEYGDSFIPHPAIEIKSEILKLQEKWQFAEGMREIVWRDTINSVSRDYPESFLVVINGELHSLGAASGVDYWHQGLERNWVSLMPKEEVFVGGISDPKTEQILFERMYGPILNKDNIWQLYDAFYTKGHKGAIDPYLDDLP